MKMYPDGIIIAEDSEMISTNLAAPAESHRIVFSKGIFSILEYEKDLSVTPEHAAEAYFASEMNVRKRQLIADVSEDTGIVMQSGAMQIMMGDIKASTNIKGAGDFLKKLAGSAVTKETAIKPHYVGEGKILLEPTFRYILLEDLDEWNGSMVIEDGMFLACEDTADIRVTSRNTVSSAVLGHEGLFNTTLFGSGVIAMESPVPADELIVVDMVDDVVKIDGNMAVAWSSDLKFTVERTTGTLIGSAASKEGLVNVYRGTGRVLIAPIRKNPGISIPEVRP